MSYRKNTIHSINHPLIIEEHGLKDNDNYSNALKIKENFYRINNKFYCKENFKLQKSLLLENTYIFFDPFVYEKDKKVIFFPEISDHEYILIDKMIVESEGIKAEFDSIKLDFSVTWTETAKVVLPKDFKIKTKNFDLFQRKFNNFLSQYIFDKKYENVKYEYSVSDENHLIRSAMFDLNFLILFDYTIAHEEKISVNFFKNNDNYKLFKNRFKIKLPSQIYVDIWDSESQYYIGNIVEYNNEYYKATQNSLDKEFSQDKWKKIEFNEFSFANNSSFYNTKQGKKNLNTLKQNIKLFIEYKIGDQIILKILFEDNDIMPNLNDYFVYKDIKYRIVKIELNQEFLKNSMIIHGLEILNFTTEGFENLMFEKNNEYFSNICQDFSSSDIFAINFNLPKSVSQKEIQEINL